MSATAPKKAKAPAAANSAKSSTPAPAASAAAPAKAKPAPTQATTTPAVASSSSSSSAAGSEKKKLLKKKKTTTKRAAHRFTIDCSEPAADEIFDIASFEKFLHDHIKVGGKVGVLGDSVTITRENAQIFVQTKIAFSKRYLKYLTKKFLKKQSLRDYIRVIARTKNGYFLRYFNFHNSEEAETEE